MAAEIRPFRPTDEGAVVALWEATGLTVPWNDPVKDVARKLTVQADLFLVAVEGDQVVGSAMAGYDGHRGWVNYLAVAPRRRRQGIGRRLMDAAEAGLRALGCPKINVQIRTSNIEAVAFYAGIGFREDAVVSMGKRLEED
jgi:ribosomal protein S18 acetylase RimI-like enzyme